MSLYAICLIGWVLHASYSPKLNIPAFSTYTYWHSELPVAMCTTSDAAQSITDNNDPLLLLLIYFLFIYIFFHVHIYILMIQVVCYVRILSFVIVACSPLAVWPI